MIQLVRTLRQGPATQTIGQWVIPIICLRRADVNCHNTKGVWRIHIWPNFSEMTELYLFRMVFPEQWVGGVLIPATNKEISGDNITLQEFYLCIWYATSSWHALR